MRKCPVPPADRAARPLSHSLAPGLLFANSRSRGNTKCGLCSRFSSLSVSCEICFPFLTQPGREVEPFVSIWGNDGTGVADSLLERGSAAGTSRNRGRADTWLAEQALSRPDPAPVTDSAGLVSFDYGSVRT
eukprot:3102122-Rhodomonas_salina.1